MVLLIKEIVTYIGPKKNKTYVKDREIPLPVSIDFY
jgi:hypothetical protein